MSASTSSALVPLLLLAPLSAASAQQFADERIVVPGAGPETAGGGELLAGDLDGDGRDELVLRDGSTDRVLRGGPGGFELVEVLEGSDSNGAAVGDLDGDGRADYLTQDFVLLGWYPGEVGATAGAFQAIQAEGPNEAFWRKAIGDLDGDGRNDVVTSVSTDAFGQEGGVRWFLNQGAGFGPPQTSATTPSYPRDLALGDFDADGDLDAACALVSGGVRVLYGTGAGLGGPQAVPDVEATFVAAGDLDADGDDDLVGLSNAATLAWLRGGPAGLAPGGSAALAGPGARDLCVVDLDADGAADVLAVRSVFGAGEIYRALGAPGTGPTALVALDAPPAMAALALEADGEPGLDLAYLPLGWLYPALRPGDGHGGFLQPLALQAGGACADADAVAAGDVDLDGALDLAFETGLWLRGDGQGGFHAEAPLGARPSALVDLDGDGRLDAVGLLPGCSAPGGLVVALAAPGGGFLPEVAPPQSAALVDLAIADLDADGDLDVAAGGPAGVDAHLNDGAGALAAAVATGLAGPCSDVGAGDLNGDGRADLARTSQVDAGGAAVFTLGWGLSAGGGQLTAIQSQTLFQAETTGVLVDDVDGDGLADVAWVQRSATYARVALGDGAGGLAPETGLAILHGDPGRSLALSDVDGDGDRDLIGGTDPGVGSAALVGIALHDGGSFALWRQIGAGDGAGKLLPYDFDGDGRVDLAWGHGNRASLARNLLAPGAGTAPFGAGTPGCLGVASIGAAQSAEVGNPGFRVQAQHLPPHGAGWIALGTKASAPGLDPIGLGALLHVDPASAFLAVLPAQADAGGQADVALPIPAQPGLAGLTLAAQALVASTPGHGCSSSPYGLVSSRGLAIAIQP